MGAVGPLTGLLNGRVHDLPRNPTGPRAGHVDTEKHQAKAPL
jgi:hypothetical protein